MMKVTLIGPVSLGIINFHAYAQEVLWPIQPALGVNTAMANENVGWSHWPS